MTNLQAYMINGVDESDGILTLERYSIDPSLEDMLQVSNALGMIAKSVAPDYKQGNTSETLNASARIYLRRQGEAIMKENGVTVLNSDITIINGRNL